jgi:hypothetical protein
VIAPPAVGVHRGGEVVGGDADRIRRRVDEPEKARVGVAERERHHVLAHEREDFVERPALLRERLAEKRRVAADFAENRP